MSRRQTVIRYAGYLFSVGGARVAGVLITSLTFPFLVRKLGLEMYGLWSYVVAVCALLDSVANPGLTTFTQQRVAAEREKAVELLPDIFALRFLSSLVAVTALVVVASLDTRADVRHLILWYGPALFAFNLIACDHILGAFEMFHARSILTVLQQAIYAVGIFAFVRTPKDVLWVPGSILVSSLVMSIGGWSVLYRAGIRLPFVLKPGRWLSILMPSVHYGASSLMSSLYHRAGHLTVRWFLGDHALGLYAASARLVDILRNFVTAILTVAMPRMALSARAPGGMARLVRLVTAVIALVSVPLVLGTIATAHLTVPLILGSKYQEAVWLVQWMAPYVVTAAAASFLAGTVAYALGMHRAYFISTACGAVVGTLLYVILTPTLGLKGAGLAFVLAEAAVAAAAYLQLPNELHGLWRNRMIPVAIIAGLLMVVAVEATSRVIVLPIAVVVLGASVYLGASAWFVKKWFTNELGGSS